MKDYSVTFGKGKEAVTVLERNCDTFAQAIQRMEITGWEYESITKVESEMAETGYHPELFFSLGYIGHKADKFKEMFNEYSEEANEFGAFLRFSNTTELVVNQGVMVHTNAFCSEEHFLERMQSKLLQLL